jgi:hypothetical protein
MKLTYKIKNNNCVLYDNANSIKMARNYIFHAQTKHIESH